MGDDWGGKFDYLKDLCEVVYLPKTPEISSTMIRNDNPNVAAYEMLNKSLTDSSGQGKA